MKFIKSDFNLTIKEMDDLYDSTKKPAWIQTFTLKKFYPLDPHIDDICIEDIAHALSNQCRFSGHINRFYSVSNHSLLVSYICDFKDALHGLLHDASEAYLVDIPKPLKESGEFEAYKKFEKKLQDLIYLKFGLSQEEPESVKQADKILLATESRDLFNGFHKDWRHQVNPLPFRINPLSPEASKTAFLDRFKELYEK